MEMLVMVAVLVVQAVQQVLKAFFTSFASKYIIPEYGLKLLN
jgi:hypothetical protein